MTMLTKHFSLEELTLSQTAARNGIDNVPAKGSDTMRNLQRLAEALEKVRAHLGSKPILISSGYRSPRVNLAVGGSKSSVHMKGLAADFTAPGFGTPLEICQKLKPLMGDLAIDQLINEFPPSGWVHLGLSEGKARQMALTIDHNGTHHGF